MDWSALPYARALSPGGPGSALPAAARTASQLVLDPDLAAELISEAYLPVRVRPQHAGTDFQMQMAVLLVGTMTAGVLTVAASSRITAEETEQFHLNVTLRGHAVSRRRGAGRIVTDAGGGVLFDPGQDADILWSDDCSQLCLMIPRETLESEIAALLGRTVSKPLAFTPHLRLDSLAGRLLAPLVQVLVSELHGPSAVQRFPSVGRHLEGLVLDALLLGQRHNYTDLLDRPSSAARTPIQHAVELIHSRPEHPWTTVGLAQEVHLSVRALQEGFRRHHDLPPMAYLREVRLLRAHRLLLGADPDGLQVQDVAAGLGFKHHGRFSTLYRERFGEPPSATLSRSPS
ncbi:MULTISPECIES: AraC family transcriptional regulator [unclassified Nocardioides]|uniref:AraC family transcriptional regulator n=1 Tax=unclassified Nocardioides TaxID=2615069 RepID=UPI0000570E4A|nr:MULTISPECIES: AraC family transcriptional regulator [unclassified Nocardioides]ABL81337.1 transcriptional regulator, AraC family [Nocardioides sp. JS614]